MKKLSLISIITVLAALLLIGVSCSSEATTSSSQTTAAAVKLVFTTQPGSAAAGASLSVLPAVRVEDANGNIVKSYKAPVSLSVVPDTGVAGAVLYGAKTAIPVNGVATFKDLSIHEAGSGYKLTAASGSLTAGVSNSFDITPGAAAKLDFSVQPVGGEAGKNFPTQPEVVVLDFYGNPVTSYQGSITVGIGYGPKAATLSGTTTVPVVNGVAHFSDIMMTMAYPDFKLMASGSSLEQVISRSFRVTATTPSKLVFTVQVEGAKAGQPFEEQPAVAVEDKYSNVVDDTGIIVTIALNPATGTAGAVLSGTKTLVADDALGGVAAYEDLAIDKAGKGYTLTATADGLSADTSKPFDVAGQ